MPKILIVEDHAVFRQSLKEILQAQFPGIVVEEAAEGNEALKKTDDLHPDLIFMDIKLPGENGLELTKKIKNRYPETPIIILTSYDLPEYRQIAFQYGANYFVPKCSSIREEILKLVKSILLDRGTTQKR